MMVNSVSNSSLSSQSLTQAPTEAQSVDWQSHRPALQSAILSGNAEAVSQVLAPLNAAERSLLLNTPLLAAEDEPRLPLCLAATTGIVGVGKALLRAPGALPFLGEATGEGTNQEVTTALYWAARAGACDFMTLLHDFYGVPRGQVLMATEERAIPEVLEWWSNHELPTAELVPALQGAAHYDDPAQVDDIVRLAGVSPDSPAPKGGTLLQEAIRANHIDTADKLLELGAKPSGGVGESPLALAVSGGHTALAVRLLRLGAPSSVEILKLVFQRETGVARMYATLAAAGVVPATVGEAADVQRLAELKKCAGLVQLTTLQHNHLARLANLAGQKANVVAQDPLLKWFEANVKTLIRELSQADSALASADADPDVKAVAVAPAAAPMQRGWVGRAARRLLSTFQRPQPRVAEQPAMARPVSAADALALVPRKRR